MPKMAKPVRSYARGSSVPPRPGIEERRAKRIRPGAMQGVRVPPRPPAAPPIGGSRASPVSDAETQALQRQQEREKHSRKTWSREASSSKSSGSPEKEWTWQNKNLRVLKPTSSAPARLVLDAPRPSQKFPTHAQPRLLLSKSPGSKRVEKLKLSELKSKGDHYDKRPWKEWQSGKEGSRGSNHSASPVRGAAKDDLTGVARAPWKTVSAASPSSSSSANASEWEPVKALVVKPVVKALVGLKPMVKAMVSSPKGKGPTPSIIPPPPKAKAAAPSIIPPPSRGKESDSASDSKNAKVKKVREIVGFSRGIKRSHVPSSASESTTAGTSSAKWDDAGPRQKQRKQWCATPVTPKSSFAPPVTPSRVPPAPPPMPVVVPTSKAPVTPPLDQPPGVFPDQPPGHFPDKPPGVHHPVVVPPAAVPATPSERAPVPPSKLPGSPPEDEFDDGAEAGNLPNESVNETPPGDWNNAGLRLSDRIAMVRTVQKAWQNRASSDGRDNPEDMQKAAPVDTGVRKTSRGPWAAIAKQEAVAHGRSRGSKSLDAGQHWSTSLNMGEDGHQQTPSASSSALPGSSFGIKPSSRASVPSKTSTLSSSFSRTDSETWQSPRSWHMKLRNGKTYAREESSFRDDTPESATSSFPSASKSEQTLKSEQSKSENPDGDAAKLEDEDLQIIDSSPDSDTEQKVSNAKMEEVDALLGLISSLEQNPIIQHGQLDEERFHGILDKLFCQGVAQDASQWIRVWRALCIPEALEMEVLQFFLMFGFGCGAHEEVAEVVEVLVKNTQVSLMSIDVSLQCIAPRLASMEIDACQGYGATLFRLFPKGPAAPWGWSRVGWNWQVWWSLVQRVLEAMQRDEAAFNVLVHLFLLLEAKSGKALSKLCWGEISANAVKELLYRYGGVNELSLKEYGLVVDE
eukprot:gnl/MRDRNA2_/MRDRNA2_74273_c0_seq1.p1 gnl/MRDRNA2_/MRDRNA2_74273_c0~~gnl/MRDRNA2_/MRDRNA2_74273_c0_seq1.p1  ORF type:complete len:912 (-),score=165.82 gnl/MRDRNA2_/MRDRNA2_74273_c0_seq1:1-2736(-)